MVWFQSNKAEMEALRGLVADSSRKETIGGQRYVDASKREDARS